MAMDYSAIPNVNSGNPFVKFYIFGPTENLLLSLSLDGRREKFMPGTCVGCHGGDSYGGKFPEDGSGRANIGSYFLPFDVANFAFSTSDPTLARDKLLLPLRQLNELLVSIPQSQPTQPITADTRSLITNRWYTSLASDEQQQTAPAIYSPSGQACSGCHGPSSSIGGYDATTKHRIVIGASCQVCHSSNASVADPQIGGSPQITFFQRPPAHYLTGKNSTTSIHGPHTICGGSKDLKMNHSMPNALATFERFWLTTDQPNSLFSFSPSNLDQGPTQPGACTTVSAHPPLF